MAAAGYCCWYRAVLAGRFRCMFDASSGCSRLDADVQRIVFVELPRLLLDFNAATGSPPCKHPTVAPWQKQCRWKISVHGAADALSQSNSPHQRLSRVFTKFGNATYAGVNVRYQHSYKLARCSTEHPGQLPKYYQDDDVSLTLRLYISSCPRRQVKVHRTLQNCCESLSRAAGPVTLRTFPFDILAHALARAS